MLKAYKYRIFPCEEQKEKLKLYFDVCRFAYNIALETKISVYKSTGKNITTIDLMKQMTDLKKEYTWISECPAESIQQSIKIIDIAYKAFFNGKNFPKFKNKHSKQTIKFVQNTWVDFGNNIIRLPKINKVVCIFDRQFNGKIKTITVSKTTTNKYFVSILVDNQADLPKKQPIKENTTVGVDLGIKTLAVLSDSTSFLNPKWLHYEKSNLKRQQRSLSRKVKGSKSREKQRLVVAKVHERITNQRVDYLHKVTTQIIRSFDTICLEDLPIKGLIKNSNLALAIQDVSWYRFKMFIEYKAKWYGKNIITIGRFEPSSKICSNCGTINKELKLNHRVWTCEKCNIQHDRDLNAAINIKNFGLRYKPVQVNVAS